MSFVSLDAVSKVFGDTTAVRSVDLRVEQGEFFSLLGPSGCGKTTTLRMLAGFIQPTTGRILIHGRDVTGLPPESRDIGMVFQNYAIFPHMTVFENIAFGLKMRKIDTREIRRRVGQALEQVGLSGYDARYERELSGGQRQRVALARVLVIEPEILLLDEPLSALDKKMREEMKFWIKDMQKSVGITTVYVTHDQGEALTMSDRIAVMDGGEILQTGTPEDIYDRPGGRFVGEFIGESNLMAAKLTRVDGSRVKAGIGDASVDATLTHGSAVEGQDVLVLLRPEKIRLVASGEAEAQLAGRIVSETYQGALIRYEIEAADALIVAETPNRPDIREYRIGDVIGLAWDPRSAIVLVD